MNTYDNPIISDELLHLLHNISGHLSELVPTKTGVENARRVIQIAATSEAGAESDLLYAVADDGTMWWIPPQASLQGAYWRRLPDIPQNAAPFCPYCGRPITTESVDA